jgi:hypothetical protein
MQVVKRVLGVFLILYGAGLFLWVGYNLLVEWTGKMKEAQIVAAVGMIVGSLYVGWQWVRGRRAFGNPDEQVRGESRRGPIVAATEKDHAASPERTPANERPWTKAPTAKAQDSSTVRLKIAQAILLFVGVLSIALNLYLLVNVDKELREVQAAGLRVSQDTIKVVRAVYIGATVLGAVFVFLGLAVWLAPLVVTIAGFLLYVAGNIIFLTYTNFAGGDANYIKLFFAIALARAISDAAAYEGKMLSERRKQLADLQSESKGNAGTKPAQDVEEREPQSEAPKPIARRKPPEPRWQVIGIDTETGRTVTREIAAESRDEAVALASLDGLDVQSVERSNAPA